MPDLEAARAHLAHVDGVMLGRAAYQNPELLIGVDPQIFGEPAPVADAFEALTAFFPVIAKGLERGERLHDFTRHLHGLFAGRRGARAFRQILAVEAAPRGRGARRARARNGAGRAGGGAGGRAPGVGRGALAARANLQPGRSKSFCRPAPARPNLISACS